MHNNIIRPTIDTSNSVNDELSADNVWYLPCINIVLKQFTDYAIAYHQYLQSNVDTADNDIIVVAFGQVMQIIRDMTADHTNRSISQKLIKNVFKFIVFEISKFVLLIYQYMCVW